MASRSQSSTHLIKKYPNRRLYDTHTSTHVNLTDIRQLVIDKITFQVVDAKSGEDLTRSILLQVIQEAESGGEPILSSEMLIGIIQFYGPFQGIFSNYLEKCIETVIDIQAYTGEQSTRVWKHFMQQAPVMQELMRQYLEPSKVLYLSTQNLFGLSGDHSPSQAEADDKPKKEDGI